MSKTAITSPELAPPVGPFSQAIEVGGFLYLSGQVGQDPATGKVVEGGIVAETERVFRNLSAVLEAAGRSFDHVARAGVYLTSMSDFGAMNGIYAKHFSQPFPARTTIAVTALERVTNAAKAGPLVARHKAALADARHAAGLAALRAGNPTHAVELLRASAAADNAVATKCDLALATRERLRALARSHAGFGLPQEPPRTARLH